MKRLSLLILLLAVFAGGCCFLPIPVYFTHGAGVEEVALDPGWPYADRSAIHTGSARLYRATDNRKDAVVGVNAGHGTEGGPSAKTYCHPDGSPKVTGGTTAAGSVMAVAVSGGMTFADGTPEAEATLGAALVEGLRGKGRRIHGGGKSAIDLTQTSYSTIPSVDIELGNQASAHDEATLSTLAEGLLDGIEGFFASQKSSPENAE